MIETNQITNLTVVGFDYRTVLSLHVTINIAGNKLFTLKTRLNYLKDKTHSTLPNTKQWHMYASQHILMVLSLEINYLFLLRYFRPKRGICWYGIVTFWVEILSGDAKPQRF